MLAMILVAALAAPGDPQHDDPGGAAILTGGQASQVGSFVSSTWPGNPLAAVQEVECWTEPGEAGECQIKVQLSNITAAAAFARLQEGWVFGPGDVTKNALDDYDIAMQSPSAAAHPNVRGWIDVVFGAGRGDAYRRLRIFRDEISPNNVRANLRVRATSTVVSWFEGWLTGASGDVVGVEN